MTRPDQMQARYDLLCRIHRQWGKAHPSFEQFRRMPGPWESLALDRLRYWNHRRPCCCGHIICTN